MTVNNLVTLMKNGAAHVLLFDICDGSILLKTIWYNLIPNDLLSCEVKSIEIRDYEMILGVEKQ